MVLGPDFGPLLRRTAKIGLIHALNLENLGKSYHNLGIYKFTESRYTIMALLQQLLQWHYWSMTTRAGPPVDYPPPPQVLVLVRGDNDLYRGVGYTLRSGAANYTIEGHNTAECSKAPSSSTPRGCSHKGLPSVDDLLMIETWVKFLVGRS